MLNIKKINFSYSNENLIISNNYEFIIKSILYASYNSILLVPALISIRDFINIRNIKYISIIVIFIIIILLDMIFLFLVNVDINIERLEMPAVYAVNMISKSLKRIYGLIILISIYTTAISLGTSFLNNVTNNRSKRMKILCFICISSILLSKIGFSNLVNNLYPLLGIFGLLQIIQILVVKTIAKKS